MDAFVYSEVPNKQARWNERYKSLLKLEIYIVHKKNQLLNEQGDKNF